MLRAGGGGGAFVRKLLRVRLGRVAGAGHPTIGFTTAFGRREAFVMAVATAAVLGVMMTHLSLAAVVAMELGARVADLTNPRKDTVSIISHGTGIGIAYHGVRVVVLVPDPYCFEYDGF